MGLVLNTLNSSTTIFYISTSVHWNNINGNYAKNWQRVSCPVDISCDNYRLFCIFYSVVDRKCFNLKLITIITIVPWIDWFHSDFSFQNKFVKIGKKLSRNFFKIQLYITHCVNRVIAFFSDLNKNTSSQYFSRYNDCISMNLSY